MNTVRPKISVITITYNSANYVRQAIESVLAQSFTDFEYIISDDCSTDNTWKIIQEYQDPRIRPWQNERNLGEYPNRNKTLKEASGEYIIWIDGDDILYKNALSEYIKFLEAFPDTKAIWGVHSAYFDFIVFPYQFTPAELTKINFLSTYPVTSIGFTDSLFHRESLVDIGGFSNSYAIGDTYVKRLFSTVFPVVLVPAGRAFWRKTRNQASEKAKSEARNILEMLQIDHQLLNSDDFPLEGDDLAKAKRNFKIRRVKLIARNTLFDLRIRRFIAMLKKLKVPVGDLKYLLNKGEYSYRGNATSENPLVNEYNFSPVKEN